MNLVRTTSARLGSRALKCWSLTMLIALLVTHLSAAAVIAAPVGNGFTVTAGDLAFILNQIKIAERHAATATPTNLCGTLVGPDIDQIPDALTAYGLRTVDGSCNNLFPGRQKFAATDVAFPRLTTPAFRSAEPITPSFPVGPPGPTSYAQKLAGNVVIDSQPRLISNLIVDQTSTNPAAIVAAEFPVRTQGNPGLHPCTVDPDPTASPPVDGVPANCVPSHKTLFIPNVTTDVGLSPPYNSLFTFFGQFFDHGVDQTVKSGGTVFVPLRADDPLISLGPDGKANTGDEVQPQNAFMVLTRAQNQPGPDGVLGTSDDIQNANNTDSPWVDQSQTYTSHPSHQVFLREYALVGGRPISTGKLLGGLDVGQTYPGSPYDARTGISSWAAVKLQAATKLGLALSDYDVTNVPMLATDPYGNFIPGLARGLPQYVTATGLVEGNLAAPVPVPTNIVHFDTPFVADIAHNADPSLQDTDNNPATPPIVPIADPDNTIQIDFTQQAPGTYDDELLNSHLSCGDGRCNENIALSAIHQIFHSEHDRLVDDITNTLNANPALLADYHAAHPFSTSADISFGFGGRLFQAARFVTEMEYQHLVFEEFARKVQPAVRPFHVYSPDINPAIEAEFAHAVYRFGHSMLDDQVARVNVDPNNPRIKHDNSLPLLTAFLNPPEFFHNGASTYTPEEAAGAIVMGSSDQVGNELDEFVTETLRNNLLGLPLDLPTINMARARSEGIPPLNDVRRQINAETNDAQLAPYTDWSDFGQHLKHPESLINFVAAYGLHPTIRDSGPDGILGNADDVTTITAKRNAARAIVNPNPGDPTATPPIPADIPPADAADFMFSTGAWANDANGHTITGLDNVDLWVGGLAEITNVFGGLLGSTFNYVFQTQLEKLQDGDRLYYLNRTPGMNLRTQLEGNSFSEMIGRNTTAFSLKADAFATADCKFDFSSNPGIAGPTPLTVPTVANDPNSGCDETALLLRKPDGTIQYKAVNSVDPSGINGQSVYDGTTGPDRMFGGNDNDTMLGNNGNDVIEGGGGDDFSIGGAGDDIITDLDGADVLKGGPGNDALDAGPGDDIVTAGDGQDFVNGGANDNEEFAGPGNDFIIAGQGADAVFGDTGDDWIEGGSGQDLLQGDHGAPFFDDPAEQAPGNDIFVGQVGENDYDAEGGDDLMAQNAAIDRNAGAGGFDWAFHQYNTEPANDDMEINQQLVGLPLPVVVNRDRWQETEADSGSNFNDVIHGDAIERIVGPGGFSGCDALDNAGVNRIAGLRKLVNTFPTLVADVIAAANVKFCPLIGSAPNNAAGTGVWAEGNVLLGGAGNDVIEGRDNNDIIDGDNELRVRISVRANADGTGAELGSTDLMEHAALSGNFGAGTTATMTLQQAVFAGKVNPGQLVAVREILTPSVPVGPSQTFTQLGATPNTSRASDCPAISAVDHIVHPTATTINCDTAEYLSELESPTGPIVNYTITSNADGSVTVADNVSVAAAAAEPFPKGDGVADTLWNIENLRFCTSTDAVTKACNAFRDVLIAPAISVAPTSLTFASRVINTGASAPQAITVSNIGVINLTVSSVTVTGPDAASFAATATGCASVAGGASCTVNVTFNPTTAGTKTATVTIASNGGTATVLVSGTATASVVGLVPTALAFGNQNVATTSAVQSIVATNNSAANVTVTSVTLSGPDAAMFTITNPAACLGVLRPTAARSCNINLRFTPTSVGAKTATVTLVSSGGTSVATVTGTGVAPIIAVSVPSVAFGSQALNVTSAQQIITVSNTGNAPLVVGAVTLNGTNPNQFQLVGTTCATVAPGGTCTITVAFRPTTAGAKTANVRIPSNAVGSPNLVPLTGTGVAVPAPVGVVTAGSLAFGNQNANTVSAGRVVTLSNTGNANLLVSSILLTGVNANQFTITTTCGTTVLPGGTCTITVVFRPTSTGNKTAALQINDNAPGSPRNLALTGRGR